MAYGQYGSSLITSFLQGIVQQLIIHMCLNNLRVKSDLVKSENN